MTDRSSYGVHGNVKKNADSVGDGSSSTDGWGPEWEDRGLDLERQSLQDRDRTTVSVCVITRERPGELRKLLAAFTELKKPEHFDWVETVIIDNDPGQSARGVCDEFVNQLPNLVYGVESRPGVVHARNTAISRSSSPWFAFIDDDMIPEETWLHILCRVASSTDADVVVGQVPIAYADAPPDGLAASGAFDFPRWDDGSQIDTLRTGNVLLKRVVLPEPPFRPALSRLGGEDHFLGRLLERQGCVIRYADEAIAHEIVAADRLTPAALRRRHRRFGAAYTNVERTLGAEGYRNDGFVKLAVGACGRAVIGGAMMVVPGLTKARRFRGSQLFWFGIGQWQSLLGGSVDFYGGETGG